MLPDRKPEKTNESSYSPLRIIALIVLLAGAAGSLGLTLRAGRHNNSILLPVLFAGWVLSPFVALLLASQISRRWALLTRSALYCLMLILSVGSLIMYSGALSPHGTKTAFVFLVFPLISWLLIAIVILIAASIAGGRR